MLYYSIYRPIARLNKLIEHKPYIVRGHCFNRVFDCSIIRVYRLENYGWAWALPRPNLATEWYTRVSAILQVLSLAFNTVNNLCLQALVTSL